MPHLLRAFGPMLLPVQHQEQVAGAAAAAATAGASLSEACQVLQAAAAAATIMAATVRTRGAATGPASMRRDCT